LAESQHGRDIFGLHDNDLLDLSNGGRGPTVLQKAVYAKAKDHWTEREKEKQKRNTKTNTPGSI
jgi:hypothetical protein